MRFAHPELLWLLLAVPALWSVLLATRASARRRLELFADPRLLRDLGVDGRTGRRIARATLRLIAFALLVVAAARPQWGASEIEVEQEGIDLVVALDISRSMLAEDLKPSRLERAKLEIGELVETLDGDRIGLVFFAGAAFPQCPMTVDYAAARLFLAQADPTMIGAQGTDLSAALFTALELFDDEGGRARLILVVTDGEDFGDGLDAATDALRDSDVTLYAVGMGTAEGAPIPDTDDSGRRSGFVRDDDGRVVMSRLQESALLGLVSATEGAYARADRGGLDVDRLRAEIAEIEGSAVKAQRIVSYQERYAWPLAAALLLLGVELFVRDRRVREENA